LIRDPNARPIKTFEPDYHLIIFLVKVNNPTLLFQCAMKLYVTKFKRRES